MSIYIDDAKNKFGRMKMSHMISDNSILELFEMAKKLGLKKEWFQDTGIPHYDVCQSKRKLAISFGAIPITSRELVKLFRKKQTP